MQKRRTKTIVVLLSFIFLILLSVQKAYSQHTASEQVKKQKKLKEDRKKDNIKTYKKALKKHLKIQSKDTRKRMKAHNRESRKINDERRTFFLKKWFKKKK